MDKNYWSEFEYSKLKLLFNKKKVDSILAVLKGEKEYDEEPPISVELHLTDKCNLKCPWCTDGKLKKNNATLEKDAILKFFDYCRDNNVGITVEGGGEPSLHPDFQQIIEYGNKSGIHMGLITNGTKDVSHLIKYFKWVRVSVDATSSEEFKKEKGVDMFENVLANLEKFSENRQPNETHLGIGYVVTTRNKDNIPGFIRKMDEIGIDYAYIRPVEEAPGITPSVEDMLKLKSEMIEIEKTARIRSIVVIGERYIKNNNHKPCFAHSLSCIIRANGEAVLCEKRRHDLTVFGSLKESTFKDTWNSDIRKSATKKLLCADSQEGCDVCRITSFNEVFLDINEINTKNFI